MQLFFLFTLALATLGIRVQFQKTKIFRSHVHELCLTFLIAYLLFILTGLLFVLLDNWSLINHSLLFLGIGVVTWFKSIYRRDFPKIEFVWAPTGFVILAAWGLGISLQWNGIYHWYATHDPSAYLNAALNISRSGTFLHHDPLIKAAHRDQEHSLIPLVRGRHWNHLPQNYGTLDKDLNQGTSSYHGMFATPLSLALSMQLFGQNNALQLHWVHLLVSLTLITAILYLCLGKNSRWPWLAPWILAASPLVTWVFREALSEPLAMVCFLGIIFAFLRFEKHPKESRYLILFLCLAGLCVRISALLYLPFACAAILYKDFKGKTFVSEWKFYLNALLIGLPVISIIYQSSGGYFLEILMFYIQMLITSLSKVPPIPVAIGTILVVGTIPFRHRVFKFLSNSRLLNINATRFWKLLCVAYVIVFSGALLFRYGKLFLKMSDYVGGFPFVLYNLESLFFYGGPLIVSIGIFYWAKQIYHAPSSHPLFITLFLPFCLFFYMAFRFFPLTLQPNFQRYLIIELFPLAVIGWILFLAKSKFSTATKRVVVVFGIIWAMGVNSMIQHQHVSTDSYSLYEKLTRKLNTIANPVLVALSPNWKNMTLLHPLKAGFGFSVLQANQGLSYSESKAITHLESHSKTPILVVDKERFVHHPWEPQRRWTKVMDLHHCYEYPMFGLGAPPLELQETCHSLSFFVPEKKKDLAKLYNSKAIQSSWKYRNQRLPFRATNWYGFSLEGGTLCSSPFSHIGVEVWVSPKDRIATTFDIFINGSRFAKHTNHGASKKTLPISIKGLDCSKTNYVDIYFEPKEGFPHRRTVTIASLKRFKLPSAAPIHTP